ncbi:MAG: IS21 family transposase [Blautia sp.]|nr:IS21 family transposase [Blautia sp.]
MKVKVKLEKKFQANKEEILRMLFMYEYQNGTSRTVAQALGCGKTKVADLYRECRKAGLTYEDAKDMSGAELCRVLGKETGEEAAVIKVADEYWEWVCRELHSSKRKTLSYIWTEFYSKDNPDGLGYSQFCRRYNNWLETASIEIILPQERIPGREIFIDWIGDTILLLDNETASQRKAYFFIATIGDSSYPFVEAFLRMDQKCWIQAHIDMLEFYGGVPRLFVPDNTKTAVVYANLYDPQLNHAYQELAHHYEVGITPARVRAPNDKPTVESGVKWLESWLLTWLEDTGKIYQDISDLNRDIRQRMAELVEKPFQKRAGSRKSVFEELDKPALRTLPGDEFLFFDTVTKKRLPANWHFEIREGKDTFYYSFPYHYAGRPGYAHLYPKKVEIYVTGVGRVAIHQRRFTGKRYVTETEHAPANQQERIKYNMRTGTYYRSKAAKIGDNTARVVKAILEAGPVEEQGYKSCDGLLRMSETYGDFALEKACKRALEAGRPNYTGVNSFLDKKAAEGGEVIIPPSETAHENLRTEGWK